MCASERTRRTTFGQPAVLPPSASLSSARRRPLSRWPVGPTVAPFAAPARARATRKRARYTRCAGMALTALGHVGHRTIDESYDGSDGLGHAAARDTAASPNSRRGADRVSGLGSRSAPAGGVEKAARGPARLGSLTHRRPHYNRPRRPPAPAGQTHRPSLLDRLSSLPLSSAVCGFAFPSPHFFLGPTLPLGQLQSPSRNLSTFCSVVFNHLLRPVSLPFLSHPHAMPVSRRASPSRPGRKTWAVIHSPAYLIGGSHD